MQLTVNLHSVYLSYFSEPVTIANSVQCAVPNFWNFSKKIRAVKIFSASIYVRKFRNLIQMFNNYDGTKFKTIAFKPKKFFHKI